MAELGNIKQYQVEYAITATGNANTFFGKMAKAAADMEAPLNQLQTHIDGVKSAFTTLQNSDTLKAMANFKPAIDLEGFKAQLSLMEEAVAKSAAKMSSDISKALKGASVNKPAQQKTVQETIKNLKSATRKELEDAKRDLRNNIFSLSNGKEPDEIKKYDRLNVNEDKIKQLKQLKQQWTALKKELESRPATPPTLTKTASSIVNTVKNAEDIGATAKSINQLNTALSKFTKNRSINIKIGADITQATTKLNTLLETIRGSVAAIPVTLGGEGKNKAGKAITKDGKMSKAGLANATTAKEDTLTAAINSKKKAMEMVAKFNEGESVAKLNESIAKLQEIASSKSITIKGKFNGEAAIAQLNETIAKLQELANSKPIKLTTSNTATNTTTTTGNTNTNTKNTKTNNSSGGNTVDKYKEEQKAVNAFKKHADSMLQMRTDLDAQQFKFEKKKALEAHNATQKMYENLWGREALSKKWKTRDDAGLSTRAKNIVKRQAENESIAAYNKHASEMTAMRSNLAAEQFKFERKKTQEAHNAAQEKYNSIFGRPALHEQWKKRDEAGLSTRAINAAKKAREAQTVKSINETSQAINKMVSGVHTAFRKAIDKEWTKRDKAGLSTRAKNNARREAISASINGFGKAADSFINLRETIRKAIHNEWLKRDKTENSTRFKNAQKRQQAFDKQWGTTAGGSADRAASHNARELARIRALNAAAQEEPAPVTTARSARGRATAMRAPMQSAGKYNAKAFWYPFTGNTSFGARTPMAVDMAKSMGVMFAIGGAMSAVQSALSQAVEYQNVMKTTNAILKNGTDTYSESGFKGMEQTVRKVGMDTKFTAPDVASAAKFLAMAGYDIKAIDTAIKPVSNIALIGDTDLGATADKLTNVMTTFNIAPEKMNDIADIMTSTFTRSNTDMMMLAESAKYAGGIANLYGGNFKNNFSDVMAMFGVLGNAGIQASSAGTTLRMMYQNLMQPNKNQLAMLKKYKIYPRDAQGKPLEMIDILKQIASKVPQGELADAVGGLFRITAQPGAAALASSLKGGENSSLLKLMEANRNAAGTGIAENIANEKKNTISGLIAQVQSTFTEGVLQAFEEREGGWAGMLMQLRDYLAQPETVEILKSIIDMVETLAKTIGNFISFYAKAFNMFPDVIKFWMQAQLVFTQFGYLVTPFVQLSTVIGRLKSMILGFIGVFTASNVTGAAGAAGMAANVAGGLANSGRTASVAAGAVAAATSAANLAKPAVNAASIANNGLVAANIASGMATYTYRKPYALGYVNTARTLSTSQSAINTLYGAQVATAIASQQQAIQQHKDRIAMYQRSQNYRMGSMTKKQRKQLNGTINRKLAELRKTPPKTASGIWVDTSYLPMPFYTTSTKAKQYLNGVRLKEKGTYMRAGASKVLPFYKYSPAASNVLYGAKPVAENRDKYSSLYSKWASVSDNKNFSAEKRAMAARRAEIYYNAYMDARAMRESQAAAKAAEDVARSQKRAAEIREMAATRHAARGAVSGKVAARYSRIYGFKNAAKLSWSSNINAGRAMGAFNMAAIVANIKSMALSLFGGIAKAFGMLTSPAGLVVTAITALTTAFIVEYNRIKKRKKEADKVAEETAKKAQNERDKANKPIKDLNEKYGRNIAISNIPQKTTATKEIEKQKEKYSKYEDAFSTKSSDEKARSLWYKAKIANTNFRLAFGDNHLSYKKGWEELEKKQNETILNYNIDTGSADLYDRQLAYTSNKYSAKARTLEALFLEGGSNNNVVKAQDKIIELRNKLLAKKISQADFIKQASDIRSSVANPNARGLLDANNYRIDEIKNFGDWSQFIQYQQGAYNVLTAEINADKGSISAYLQGVETLKNGVASYGSQWWDAVSDIYSGMNYVIQNGKERIEVAFQTLPNGKIDYSGIIEQINQINKNLQLALSDFANMAASVYKKLAELGVAPGNYYSDWYKFVYSNIEHTTISKDTARQYWREKVRPNLAKAAPWAQTEEGYADYVTTSKDVTAGKERVNIRKSTAASIAYNAKDQNDKRLAALKANTPNADNKNNPGGSTTGTYGGNPKDDKKKHNQKDYANTYDRSAARPTQVIINIDSLARFDRTAIAKNADEQSIVEAIENKIAEAVTMLSAQALNSASSLIAQNV